MTSPGDEKPIAHLMPVKPTAGWLHSPSAKAEIKKHIKTANDKEAAIAAAEAKCLETPEELAKLPVIYRWSTTKNA